MKIKLNNYKIIPNLVNENLFSYKIPKTGSFKNGIALRNLSYKYGLDVAIKAYSGLKNTSLTIVGIGLLEQKLKKMVKNLKSNVKFITKIFRHNEIPKLLKQYDYFVAPSIIEAQGLAMCEAMTCGLPVITTNVGGIPEFVENNKEGYIVPPNDVESLRKAVIKLMSDEKNLKNFQEMRGRK